MRSFAGVARALTRVRRLALPLAVLAGCSQDAASSSEMPTVPSLGALANPDPASGRVGDAENGAGSSDDDAGNLGGPGDSTSQGTGAERGLGGSPVAGGGAVLQPPAREAGGTAGQPIAPPAPCEPTVPPSLCELVGGLEQTLFKLTVASYDADGQAGCGISPEQQHQEKSDMVVGDLATTYAVTFRVRGLIELRTYQGGARDPESEFVYVGGEPHPGAGGRQGQSIVLTMQTEEPEQVYYLNALHGDHTDHQVYPMDYVLTVDAIGGSSITIVLDDPNDCATANQDDKVVDGVPEDLVSQPFKDQFLLVETVSVSTVP